MAKRIEEIIRFAAQIHEWEIYEFAVNVDHVHFCIGPQPKFAPSKIMKII